MVHVCHKSLNKAYSPLNYTSQPFKLPLCGLVVFIDMNTTCTYLQKEAGVSKHYLKKIMQLLWTVVTYLQKMLSMELNMMLIVLMEIFPEIKETFLDIPTLLKFTLDLIDETFLAI